jgi:hypothetical protein
VTHGDVLSSANVSRNAASSSPASLRGAAIQEMGPSRVPTSEDPATVAAGRASGKPMERAMAGKADFSPEEWQQVLGGVFLAGFAVSAAEPSGLWGMLKETVASGRAILEAKATAGDRRQLSPILKPQRVAPMPKSSSRDD